MMCLSKKKSFLALAALCFFCVPAQLHADGDEALRKALGIGGICLVAHGLYKFVTLHPLKGIASMVCGAVVGVGGVCSDIILQRVHELIEQNKQIGQEQSIVKQAKAAVQTVYSGALAPAGNEVRYRYQFSQGRDSMAHGKFMTGLDQLYDGGYHYVRGECRKILYQQYDC